MYNVGTEKKSIYQLAKRTKEDVKEIVSPPHVPKDISMNCSKMENFILNLYQISEWIIMDTKSYVIKLKHNLTDIVLGEKIIIPQGEIILNNISGDTLSLLEFPIVVREHGNGIKTFAQKTDCIIEELWN